MNNTLHTIKKEVYDKCGFELTQFQLEAEGKAYEACRFQLGGLAIVCRSAKITPKKAGQFVTFWKRKENGPIEPLSETDAIDYCVVNVRTENRLGQFVFPKLILIKRGIISTSTKEGKRAFRVYPTWDEVKSKQAVQTQKWQHSYFYEIDTTTDLVKVNELYNLF